MFYSRLFRSKWAALFWAASVLLGTFLRTPRDNVPEQKRPAQAAHVNPWAKTPG
jgi:hypothetical protein